MLSVSGEYLEVPPKNFEKVISSPLPIINLIEEVPRKEVGDLSKTSTKVQIERETKIMRTVARRFIALFENIGAFIFIFELGFNRCIRKVKKLFPNIDPNFLTLMNQDAQSLIEKILGENPSSFVEVANSILDAGIEIVDTGPPAKDYPPSSSLIDKGPSPSLAKP